MIAQTAFAAALLDPDLPPPDGLIAWNGSDPVRRFAVYRNNVVVSLVDALADTFAVTQELVGETFFRAMARVFALSEPPRSRLMAFYGEDFPDFIAGFLPAAGVPYLADVARLEYLRVLAYHAADAAPLAADELAAALTDTETLPALRVVLHPSLHVLASRFAVASLWGAHQGLLAFADVVPDQPETALVLRCGLDVEVLRIMPADGVFISALGDGVPLGGAVQVAGPRFDPAGALGLLLQKGAVVALVREEEPRSDELLSRR
jgi:hypothetical protein